MIEQRCCGDVWTYAIEAQTKLVISWPVGRRDAGCATEFLQDVESRWTNRIPLTTDGHRMYLAVVRDAFGEVIDEVYGNDPESEKQYSAMWLWPIRRMRGQPSSFSGPR